MRVVRRNLDDREDGRLRLIHAVLSAFDHSQEPARVVVEAREYLP